MTFQSSFEKYTDLSTPDYFRFIFHCERCGAGVISDKYIFNTGDLTLPLAENVRALLWARQHAAAKERAQNDAKFEFNVCRVCGRKICDRCFSLFAESLAGVCTYCKGAGSKNGFADTVCHIQA